ncbi:MAG: type I DNA topoisomerase [Lentisphaeria bacterium]|nr:type I DNA topoisomerase [Lentisphaeria bacterium]
MNRLLIVESPTKANTIGKMLGKDYTIIASMGHIRNLPEHDLGVDIEHDFTPQYVDTPKSRSIVKRLRDAAKKADEIYLAPDPDREGEAIAWHLKDVLQKSTKAPFYRVTFHEITRTAIENAIANRGEIDPDLVDAQQARRVLDRIVGYKTSPLLWRQLEKGSSAGRVQSAALRLVVEREREIAAFTPEEYWNFAVEFDASAAGIYHARLFKINGKDFKVTNEKDALFLKNAVLNGSAPKVEEINRQERRRFAAPPFTTSTLQQAASSNLRMSATGTMRCAQQLYEGVELGNGGAVGLITYMRTDSVTIAKEAQFAAKEFITETYGAAYAPEKFNFYKNKAAAQEAHEAIRPTDVRRTPESVAPYLDPTQLKLYTLIWKRFVASQMSCCRIDQTTVDTNISGADNNLFTFRSVGSVVTFPGFTKLYEYADKETKEKDESPVLARLATGMQVVISKFDSAQKFTEPPPRFNEASLIKALEENGIGRPSTYATIMRTIQDREYVKRDQGRLIPTELGIKVNDFLVSRLPELFDIGFTAQMEEKLDQVEEGKQPWVDMMQEFYGKFINWVQEAKNVGAPEASDAQAMLSLFDNVSYAPARKVGRRTYDDADFVRSVREKYDADHKISAKQYSALINLAARYFDSFLAQSLSSLPETLRSLLETEAVKLKEKTIEQEKSAAQAKEIDYAGLFAAFDNVKWDEPIKKGRMTYDDKKFFDSLKKQALSGKLLSDRQSAALTKMAEKYQAQLTNRDLVFEILKSDAPQNTASENAEQPAATPEADVKLLIENLSKVKNWEEPVRKGRFSFDDKKFFQSVKKQFDDGKTLSPKQIAALSKLAAKYGEKTNE